MLYSCVITDPGREMEPFTKTVAAGTARDAALLLGRYLLKETGAFPEEGDVNDVKVYELEEAPMGVLHEFQPEVFSLVRKGKGVVIDENKPLDPTDLDKPSLEQIAMRVINALLNHQPQAAIQEIEHSLRAFGLLAKEPT